LQKHNAKVDFLKIGNDNNYILEDNIDNINQTLKNHYLKQEYAQAAEFLLANQSKLEPGIFHYQLGTVLYKLNDLPKARFHFEQARLLGMSGSEIQNNLNVVKHQLNVVGQEQIESMSSAIPYNLYHWSNYSYFSFVLLFILLAGILKYYKKSKYLVITTLLLSLLPAGFWMIKTRQVLLAITKQETAVHEGPSAAFSSVRKLAAGTKIVATKRDGEWYLVDYPENFVGWIKLENLYQIKR
jgi:hypothetical protein